MNIRQALQKYTKKLKLQNIPSANLDAEVLLLEALNKHGKNIEKSWLYSNSEYSLSKDEERTLNNFINQRLNYKPVAYLTNQKEFYGYSFYVNKNVLVPRPETELIVEETLKIINNQENKQNDFGFTLIDIGTGSGCIIISIINELIKTKKDRLIRSAFANDLSHRAIEVANINAERYNLSEKIKFIEGDLKKAINKKTFSASNHIIITANLPYIKNKDYEKLPEDIKKYEPEIALKGGKQGLNLIEKLINKTSELKLLPRKKVFIVIEADPNQTNRIKVVSSERLHKANTKIIKDLSHKNRVVLIEINGPNYKKPQT
jgi:release factor glutamine methyltransferase